MCSVVVLAIFFGDVAAVDFVFGGMDLDLGAFARVFPPVCHNPFYDTIHVANVPDGQRLSASSEAGVGDFRLLSKQRRTLHIRRDRRYQTNTTPRRGNDDEYVTRRNAKNNAHAHAHAHTRARARTIENTNPIAEIQLPIANTLP